ncbi:MAG: glycosyltransferase family 2 protein [Bacteroidales bacterium]|nr:glycosyltransferase family 2 protein [Bacteroidales bacterium]
MKTVSVILTTFNSERFIARTLNSILNQKGVGTDFNLEVIVVDDFSNDRTLDILKAYNIKIISTNYNSGGPNRGRNIGIKAATGDYLCIADHDDEWVEDKILNQLPYLQQAPIVSSGYTVTDIHTNKKLLRYDESPDGAVFYAENETFLNKLKKTNKGQKAYLGSLIFHSNLKNILFEESFGVVDFDWILRLFHKQRSVEISRPLYNRWVESSNLSLNESYRRKDFYYSLMIIEDYRALYPKEVNIAYKRIHGSRARYYYLMGNMKLARFFFARSECSIKTLAYYLTTFFGSSFVKKHFNVFG